MQYDRRCCSLQAVSKYFGVKSIAMYRPYIAGVGIIVRYCGCPSTLFDRWESHINRGRGRQGGLSSARSQAGLCASQWLNLPFPDPCPGRYRNDQPSEMGPNYQPGPIWAAAQINKLMELRWAGRVSTAAIKARFVSSRPYWLGQPRGRYGRRVIE